MSAVETVKLCEKQLDTTIKIDKLPNEQATEKLLTAIVGDAKTAPLATREQAQRMLLHYEDRGLQGNPNVLRWLLGREPMQWEDWLNIQVQKAKSSF